MYVYSAFFLLIIIVLAAFKVCNKIPIRQFKIKAKCNYMAYACGECEPQYKVESVLSIDGIDKNKILNQDIEIVFKSPVLEKIDSITQKCAICYDYYVQGYIFYLKEKKYYRLIADTCEVKLRFADCCK